MPVHPNSLENLKKGKKFSQTYKPKNTGRRKDYLNELIDENRVSLNDLKIILENILADHSFADLEKILARGQKTLPVFIAGYIKALIVDLKKGNTATVEKMMDRVYGKPTQVSVVEFVDIPDGAKDRLDKIFNEINEEKELLSTESEGLGSVGKEEDE